MHTYMSVRWVYGESRMNLDEMNECGLKLRGGGDEMIRVLAWINEMARI